MKKYAVGFVLVSLLAVGTLFGRLYPGSNLNNLLIGGQWNQQVDIAFKAAVSSPLGSIRLYEITQNPPSEPGGYAGGTGGVVHYELYSDSNGIPGHLIAGGILLDDPQYTEWINYGGFPIISFPTTPLLVANTWYHFVLTNVDKQPTTNYISADFLISATGNNPDPNSFVAYRPAGSPWTKYPSLIASPFAVFYADGNVQGNGGYEIGSSGQTLCGSEYGFPTGICN